LYTLSNTIIKELLNPAAPRYHYSLVRGNYSQAAVPPFFTLGPAHLREKRIISQKLSEVCPTGVEVFPYLDNYEKSANSEVDFSA